MQVEQQICGALLAGGQATRMGKVNKGSLFVGKYSLASLALQRMHSQVNNILISANEYLSFYETFGYPVFADIRTGHLGPLAGIETLLTHCSAEWVFCAPVDVPFYPNNIVLRLYESAKQESASCAYPVTALGDQPLFCLLHKSLLKNLTTYLNEDNHKVSNWLAKNNALKVFFATGEYDFVNINTPRDLEQFLSIFNQRHEPELKNL